MTLTGRTADQEALEQALEEARLVTLLGPSGVGKSKIAEAMAARAAGIIVVLERVPVGPPEALAQHIADACGRPLSEGAKGNTFLQGVSPLVLDGADGHAEALAALLPVWFAEHSTLRVVATSRAPLGLSMERLMTVPPLPLDDARTLFLERATQVAPQFVPDDEGALDRLLRATAGLPLAIELAAGQMRVKTCTELALALDGQEHALSGGHLDAPERHRSVAAAIETSVNTLSPTARRTFSHCGAFAGAFTREALAHVMRAKAHEAQAGIEELVHASLLSATQANHEMRFDLLSPVRAYAATLLKTNAEDHDAMAAHAHYFSQRYSPTAEISEHDVADLRRLKRSALDKGEVEHVSRAALALAAEAQRRGAAHDVREALKLTGGNDLPAHIGAAMALAKARARLVFRREDASALLDDAAAALRSHAEHSTAWTPALEVEHAALAALNARVLGADGVEAAFDRALSKAEALDHHPTLARLRSDFAAAMFERREFSRSRALFLDVLDDAIALGDERAEGVARTNLALVLQEAGDLDEADASMRKALALHRKVGNARFEAITLSDLGALSIERTLWRKAQDDFEAAVGALEKLGDRRHEGLARAALALCFGLLDDKTAAERELRRAARCIDASSNDPFLVALAIYRDTIALLAAAQLRFTDAARFDASVGDRLSAQIDAHATHSHAERSDEVRLAHRLVKDVVHAWRTSTLAVSPSTHRIFTTSKGASTVVDLSEKRALREILLALVDNRLRETDGVDKEALINAGWPGEKMSASSAKNRLHVSISGLRKAGVGDAIVASNDRYRLVPNAPLVIVR